MLLVLAVLPIAAATQSPVLAWRSSIYIAAGFAGIAALTLLLLQPLAASSQLPGVKFNVARRIHLILGTSIIAFVLMHIAGLWVTSPPDMVDALLFRSPTPFSVWGVIAMWALLAVGLMAGYRKRWTFGPAGWRVLHGILVTITVLGSVVHAILVEGAMEPVTKLVLCVSVLITLGIAMVARKTWRAFR